MLKDLVEYIAKSLVDAPDAVHVAQKDGDQAITLELTVARDDLGKVIGKQGRTAKAMRTILSAASTRAQKRCLLEILE